MVHDHDPNATDVDAEVALLEYLAVLTAAPA
jgi:hypothetical protein